MYATTLKELLIMNITTPSGYNIKINGNDVKVTTPKSLIFEMSKQEFEKQFKTLYQQIFEELSDNNSGEDMLFGLFKLVLERRPLGENPEKLIRKLYLSKNRVSMPELAKELNLTSQQISGVLGALGRRINNTQGIDTENGIGFLFDIRNDKGIWHYTLTDEFRKFLDDSNYDWLK
jgi:hypothetical protein